MSRIEWVVLSRLGTRVLVTLFVTFGLIALVESLNAGRFEALANLGGIWLALLGIIANAARWTIKTLPVTVLLGSIIGLVDLQARRELVIIKAAGFSIWRILRAPAIVLFLLSALVSLWLESETAAINRTLTPTPPGQTGLLTPPGEVWLQQRGEGQRYVLMAERVQPGGTSIENVTVFLIESAEGDRIRAPVAELGKGVWRFPSAVRERPDAPREVLSDFELQTTSTVADLRLRIGSTEDLTFLELLSALRIGISDPAIRSAAFMRLLRLTTMPLLLTGSLFIAFAFTAGYRRTNKFGTAMLYGTVLGIIVFVVTEMADRAGSAGVLQPYLAALGPALFAILTGLTVLLHKEDGRV